MANYQVVTLRKPNKCRRCGTRLYAGRRAYHWGWGVFWCCNCM